MPFTRLVSLLWIGIWLSPIYVQETTDEPTPDVSSEEKSADTLEETVEVTDELKNKSQTILYIVSVEESPPIIEDDSSTGITITGEEINSMPVDDIEQVLENLVPGAVNTSPWIAP